MVRTYVALLRGINVGGNNLIKMADLRSCLAIAGFDNVRTYIASGNVLFNSSLSLDDAQRIFDSSVEETFGYKGPTVLLTDADLYTILREAPDDFGTTPDAHLFDIIFLKPPLSSDCALQAVLDLNLNSDIDTATAGTKALYFTRLRAQRTKSRLSKVIGLPIYKNMTIRSWNTTKNLTQLLSDQLDSE